MMSSSELLSLTRCARSIPTLSTIPSTLAQRTPLPCLYPNAITPSSWESFEDFQKIFGSLPVSVKSRISVSSTGGLSGGKCIVKVAELHRHLNDKQVHFCTNRTPLHTALIAAHPVTPPARSLLNGISMHGVTSITFGAGGGLAFHQHAPSWLGCLFGTKLWFFLSPSKASRFMPELVQNDGGISSITVQDIVHGESEAAGKLRKSLLFAIQEPGGVVTVPGGYYHATLSLTDNCIGVGGIGESKGVHYFVAIDDLETVKAMSDHEVEGKVGGGPLSASSGRTALHTAAYHGNLRMVRHFVEERGLSCEVVDQRGKSPADWAKERQHSDVFAYLATKR